MLTQTITKAKVRDAVWMCEDTKSHEPDGFNFGFIKKHWDGFKTRCATSSK